MDELAPLECVLDEHFLELKIQTPVPAFNSFSVLMAIIAKECPKLKDLELKFDTTPYYKLVNKIPSVFGPQDRQLECLTTLNLVCGHYDTKSSSVDQACQSILRVIGKCCPSLIKLSVSLGFPLTKKHLFGLIIRGEVSDILFPIDDEGWSHDLVLAGLQVPYELLNPLCQTLQELNVETGHACFIQPDVDGKRNWLVLERVFPSASTYAFALRQLPKLKKIKLDVPLNEIFKILYAAKEVDNQQQQTEFERDCQNAAISSGALEENSIISSPIPFSGKYDNNSFIWLIIISNILFPSVPLSIL